MPSVSEKQKKFMAAVAHSPEFAKKLGFLNLSVKNITMLTKPKTKRNNTTERI